MVKIYFMKPLFAMLALMCCVQIVSAQDLSAYEKKEFIKGKDTLRYRIIYPEKYRKHKAYPLLLVLHGSGERGHDNEAQLVHGGKRFLEENIRKHFKAIVIFPQCPKDSTWSRYRRTGTTLSIQTADNPTVPQLLVKELIDEMVAEKKLDERRLYVGGLSMGGMGTYDMLTRYPDYFAAAFPICGIANIPLFIDRSSQIPLWIFHGGKDNTVSPEPDRELYKALMTRGIKTVNYTEYPSMGHNSWDSAFIEPKLLPWLFSNKKKN